MVDMELADVPDNEMTRLAEWQDHTILDTPSEETFDNLTRLAAQICGTPIALLGLFNIDRLWLKSKVGLEVSEIPRNNVFCAHTIVVSDCLVVSDTTIDSRFADDPLVTMDPNIRFYAGLPLITSQGHAMGMLCVMDRVPRQLTPEQIWALQMLGHQAVDQLKLRRRNIELEKSVVAYRQAEKLNAGLLLAIDHSMEGLALLNKDGCYTYINRAHAALYGYHVDELIGQSWKMLYTPEWIDKIKQLYFPILLSLGRWRGELTGKTKSGCEISLEVALTLLQSQGNPDQWIMCACRDITEYKATATLLQIEHKSLTQAQALAHLGSWEWDIRTGVESWSDEQFRIFGYTPGAITPTNGLFREALHPDDRARVLQSIETVLAKNQPYCEMDCKIIRPDGNCRHIHYRGTVTRDVENYPVRMAGTIQDITELKAVEQVLNDTLQRLHVATESGGIGIWEYFISENRLVWDKRMLELYGYTDDNFSATFEAWTSRLHPEDKARSEAALQVAVERGSTFDMEFRLVLPGDVLRHIKASAVILRDKEGNAVRMVGVNYDISTTKQAEIAQRHLAAIVKSSDDAIIGMDLAGYITSWNHGAEHIFGYTEEEILGRAGTVLMLPSHTSKETKVLAHLLHQERIEHFETQHRCKNGQTVDVSVSISPIKDLAGIIVGFAKVARDITERKTIELKLERVARDLENRNQDLAAATVQALRATRAKSEFLAAMSHEIRTPMNAIVGMAELLHETPLTPDQQNYVDRLGRAATSLMELINAILDLSKIEAGHMELESIPFDLPDLVDSVVQVMAIQAAAKQLEFLVHVHPDVPSNVVGDPMRLHQVLVNLTGNAIKFTESGHVMIKVEPAGGRLPLRAFRFSVLDTGIGIPKTKLQIIFKSFTQADSAMT